MKTCNHLLKECEELKQKVTSSGSPLNNNESWSLNHQLQVVCGQLLVEYQETALEKGIERELWNVAFRNNINQLQAETQVKKKGTHEARDVLNWFLNSASGFYLQLLNQICSANSLDLVFRRKDSLYGMLGGGLSSARNDNVKTSTTKNALYLCQYCLIHLGDLARYRHHPKQSETFYRHAVTVSVTSGHPYNQLALLEAGRGNRLAAVFLYIRAICVAAPFTGAPSNLHQTFNKVFNGSTNEDSTSAEVKMGTLVRMTKEEYINLFLHFHSSLLLKGNIDLAKNDLPKLTSALSTLVATTALTRSSLIHMFIVTHFSMLYFSERVNLKVGDAETSKKEEDLFIDPKKCSADCLSLLDDLMVGMLAALLLPIHTMKEPDVVMTFIALPAIRLMLEWILLEDKLLSPSLKEKQQIWPGLCTLVNFLQQSLGSFDSKSYDEIPLPEDWDLQGFQPLSKLLSRYKFREANPRPTHEDFGLLRAHRLTDLANKFSKDDLEGGALLKKNCENAEGKLVFEPQANQLPPVEDVLNLERLTLHPPTEPKSVPHVKKKEKVGILKPQGSLERSKEGRDVSTSKKILTPTTKKDKKFPSHNDDKKVTIGGPGGSKPIILSSSDTLTVPPSTRPKNRTNVALQAILKRNSNNQESKQVTFQACSPTTSPNPSDASNESQRSQLSTPPLTLVANAQSEVRSSSPLAAALGSQMNFSQQQTHLVSPKSTVSQPSLPFRWRDAPPPSIRQISPGNKHFTEQFVNPPHQRMEGPQSSSRANNAGIRPNLMEQPVGSFPLGRDPKSRGAQNQPFRVSQTDHLFSGDSFQKNDPRMPAFATKFNTPATSWDRPSTAAPTNTRSDAILQPIMQNNTALLHGSVQNRPPVLDSHFKEVPTFSQQQPVKSSLNKGYQQAFAPQQMSFPLSLPSQEQKDSFLQRSPPQINTPYHDRTADSKPEQTFLSNSGSLFTSMPSSQPPNYYSPVPNSGWWQKDVPPPSQRISNTTFSQMLNRPPLGNLTGNAPTIDVSVPPPPLGNVSIPPPVGIPPPFQPLSMNAKSGLSSTESPPRSDQNSSQESSDMGIRSSSTYSLFGPLGGIDPPNQQLPPHFMFNSSSNHQTRQNLWSGPSPLERLLEQKKFGSGKS